MDKRKLNLSVMPSFYCNYNCPFCYLGTLINDKQLLDLDVLKFRLEELSSKYALNDVTIYGGEISILPKSYVKSLVDILQKYNITFVTNLSNDWLIDFCDDMKLSVTISLNSERPNYFKTIDKIKSLKIKDNKSVSVVVLPSIINTPIKDLLMFYDELGLDVFFMQYHPSCYNNLKYDVTLDEYSIFLKSIIKEHRNGDYKIKIANEMIFNDDEYNPCESGHVFINPRGNYSTVSYKEYIESQIEFKTLKEWEEYCCIIYQNYFSSCCMCELFGKCKAEHLEILDKKECSGLYNLINWYNSND